ncbi:MAG: citrate synthase [Candidatus Omnitrophica bacterium]|nr:citrate synthase [Candidatus Omnitrophota bacterium]
MNTKHPETETEKGAHVSQSNPETAQLKLGGKVVDLSVMTGSEQEKGIDISRLRDSTGAVTLDPGFVNTASCTSGITFLDGERGILRYRGYPIEELAEYATHSEVAYLLIYGNLPSRRELEQFTGRIAERYDLPDGMERIFDNFPKTAHPMAVLSSATAALSGYYPELTHPSPTREEMDAVILTLLAQVSTIAAFGYRRRHGLPIIPPRRDASPVANFLYILFGSSANPQQPDEVIVRALRQVLILHADHEQNCSTSTVRMVGSSRANAFVSISAGMAALWGPLHGGANQEVIEMLEAIHQAGGDFGKYIGMAKDKTSGFRLMGFGHRVYKNFDPRAKILKAACDKVLARLGVHDPLLDLAKHLEEVALKDEYFISRKLYPNVDFYSGILLRAIGIPTDQFTVIFALGRLAGWLAHWREMLESPGFKINRPRQIYTGPPERKYVPLAQRS